MSASGRSGRTLYDRIFDSHLVDERPDGTCQLYVGMHYLNEVTSAPAFASLAKAGLAVARPDRTVAFVDHVVAETGAVGFADAESRSLAEGLAANCVRHRIPLMGVGSPSHGIVHVVGPETGLTQPGMVVCCGDSHTSTHGALGSLAFGIGTSQVRDVLATQSLLTRRLAVRRIHLEGCLPDGVEAKDVILHLIRQLGVDGGLGYAYEYAGPAVAAMSMEERMTLCNMSVEGGAQIGYVCPDSVTTRYLADRLSLGQAQLDEAGSWWESLRSDPDSLYDDDVRIGVGSLAPMVTWGIHPGQSVEIDETIPVPGTDDTPEGRSAREALLHMGLQAGVPLIGTPIDVAFVGSCANSRATDIRRVAQLVRRRGGRVARGVRAVVAPGSLRVLEQARREGWIDTLEEAGFTVANPGCSLCIGMNGSPLLDGQLCASTSTRNFKGRQGAARGRTLLMNPTMVAAAALEGRVVDVRGWAAS